MQPELRPCNWSCGQVYLTMLQLAADLLALCALQAPELAGRATVTPQALALEPLRSPGELLKILGKFP